MPKSRADREATVRPSVQPGPILVPCLMIRGGRVVVPGPEGPEVARTASGAEYEIFDVLDSLAARYPRLYVVDLDGVEREDPQLDYLQEIARDTEIWVDAGVRNSDQAIDALVTGATRAVLSTSALEDPRELERAWSLSQELVFEVAIREGTVEAVAETWRASDPATVAAFARSKGLRDVVLSPREASIDWGLVRSVSQGGPTWVGGNLEASELRGLSESGATGAIFHLGGDLLATPEGSPWSSFSLPPPGRRRDET